VKIFIEEIYFVLPILRFPSTVCFVEAVNSLATLDFLIPVTGYYILRQSNFPNTFCRVVCHVWQGCEGGGCLLSVIAEGRERSKFEVV
jgi:hypothetical protein